MSIGCIICSEVFGSNDSGESAPVSIKVCGHVFHKVCLQNWYKKSVTCPVCRAKTTKSINSLLRLHFDAASDLDSSQVTQKLEDALALKEIELEQQSSETKEAKKKLQQQSTEIGDLKKKLEEKDKEIERMKTVNKQALDGQNDGKQKVRRSTRKSSLEPSAFVDLVNLDQSSDTPIVARKRRAARPELNSQEGNKKLKKSP